MSDQTEQAPADRTGRAPARGGRLRANAIGLKDAVIVGMASSGPTASIALTLAAIVGASNYGGAHAGHHPVSRVHGRMDHAARLLPGDDLRRPADRAVRPGRVRPGVPELDVRDG